MSLDEIRSRLKKSENHRELSVALLVCAATKLYEFGIDFSKFKKELRKLLREQKVFEESMLKLCRLVLDAAGMIRGEHGHEEMREDPDGRSEEEFIGRIGQLAQNQASGVERWLTSE
ncbi:hypothetical protein AS159_05205 [Thermotoga sp. Ku-13t]|uniref:hypothetical protein n=1 Tax=Thermotoga sp. Ku-13t TaxID=1755813 RepID=UPI0013EE287B|nr:hypothetical protein [Thermotoga sp. Ku-13t]KAF2957805.1 hypothetical protein AS159_05205 [Thermotoga sp. Ku-13t]